VHDVVSGRFVRNRREIGQCEIPSPTSPTSHPPSRSATLFRFGTFLKLTEKLRSPTRDFPPNEIRGSLTFILICTAAPARGSDRPSDSSSASVRRLMHKEKPWSPVTAETRRRREPTVSTVHHGEYRKLVSGTEDPLELSKHLP